MRLITIDILWRDQRLKRHRAWLRRWLSSQLGRIRKGSELSVLVTGSREMRALNRRFRGVDEVSAVLTFSGSQNTIGDIVVAAPVVEQYARHAGISVRSAFQHVFQHAFRRLGLNRNGS